MGVYGPGQSKQAHLRMLVASLWAALTVGFTYSFSVYSAALQAKFHLTQAQLSTIGTAPIAINLLSITCGLLVEWIGVRLTLVAGACINSVAWFFYGLIVMHGRLPWGLLTPAFTALAALATFGAGCTVAAVFSALAKNFVEERGTAVGITKAWIGFASGIATTLCVNVMPTSDDDPRRLNFFWYMGCGVLLLGLLPAPFIRILNTSRLVPLKGLATDTSYQRQFLILVAVTLVPILVTSVPNFLQGELPHPLVVMLSMSMLAIMLSPASLVVGDVYDDIQAEEIPARTATSPSTRATAASNTDRGIRRGSPWECGPLGLLARIDAWLLWVAVFALHSGGILLTANLGSIAQSQPATQVSAATAVGTFSCSNSVGRLLGGILSDLTVRYNIPRPWCLVVLLMCMGIAHALLCAPGPEPLIAGVLLAGLAFGSTFPVTLCTVAELFGTARVASNYMVYDGTPMSMGSIFVTNVFARFFLQSSTDPRSGLCDGSSCHRPAFISMVVLQMVAAAGMSVLATRSAVVYQLSVWPPRCEEVGEASVTAA